MVKTHEVSVNTSKFNQVVNNNYIILEMAEIEKNDFILFKEIEVVDNREKYTELYQMTRVKDVINNEGLKNGFILLQLENIN